MEQPVQNGLIDKSFHHSNHSFWSKCINCNPADVDLSVVCYLLFYVLYFNWQKF